MNRFNRYQYEVRLLRAYYYFLLVRAYGDVPFTVNVLTEKEANSLSRTPASEVFDFIISEVRPYIYHPVRPSDTDHTDSSSARCKLP